MLNKMTLSNFGRHEDLTVDFGPGLVAIRSQNEGGKSTLMKGVLYALFGTKALPDSLEDTVTWGKPAAALKVKLTFTVNGEIYEITRGKSGAELVSATATVTGQTETAKAVADLLGVDAAMAANILVAEQGAIRGALTGGSKGATALIEKLADFEQLENLLDALQAALPAGSTVAVRAAVEEAERVLAETEEPGPLDLSEHEAELKAMHKDAEAFTSGIASASDDLKKVRDDRQALLTKVEANRQAEAKVERLTGALDALRSAAPVAQVWGAEQEAELQRAQDTVLQVQGEVKALTEHEKVVELNAGIVQDWGSVQGENDRYEGDLESAQRERADELQTAELASKEIAAAQDRQTRAKALIITNSCTLCGRDVSDIPEVAERNAKLEDEAKQAGLDKAVFTQRREGAEAFATALKQVIDAHATLVNAAKGLPVTVDDSMVPGTLVWAGAPVNFAARAALEEATAAFKKVDAAKSSALESKRAAKQHAERVQRAEEELDTAIEAARGAGGEDPTPAIQKLNLEATNLEATLEMLKGRLSTARTEAAKLEGVLTLARANHEHAVKARAAAHATVATRKGELQELEFNNALMKAVREARPVVANKLWALVLGAVSQYFSDMRGRPCTVARGDNGFTVDGYPVSTLSGSTKDILGLAIRVALVRTFLPNIGMLLLDEPNAAMDDERTSNVLGFIAGVGFDQTIVVSHDELTVDVADHVVTLE